MGVSIQMHDSIEPTPNVDEDLRGNGPTSFTNLRPKLMAQILEDHDLESGAALGASECGSTRRVDHW